MEIKKDLAPLSYADMAKGVGSSYTLPSWFLAQNVSRPSMQPQDEAGTALDDETLAELLEATSALLLPSENGKFSKESTIVFRMEGMSTRTPILEPELMRRIVARVANASNLALIYLDLPTLEELGSAFYHQDNQRRGNQTSSAAGWEPNVDSFTMFLERFFAARPKTLADRVSCKQRHAALSAILDAAKTQEGDTNDAVLVHILLDCSFSNETVEARLLECIAEMVQARRDQGQAVALLLSTKCPSYMPGTKEFGRIGATEALTVTAINDNIHDLERRNRTQTGFINTQRLRRFMRLRLPSNLFCTELLEYRSDWASADRGQNYESFGWKLWSIADVIKVITQLRGRVRGQGGTRSQKTFADIRVVLEYLELFDQVEAEAEIQNTEDENDADDSEQPPTSTPATTPTDSVSGNEPSGWSSAVSRAGQEWQQQKSQQKDHNVVLDSLMNLVGLEGPKSQFMNIKSLIDTARRQESSLAQESFGAVFAGGQGTGKSTVAELYAKFLASLGFVPHRAFEQTTGARLAAGGPAECRSIIERFQEPAYDEETDREYSEITGGVIFIDGAHELVSDAAAKKTFNYLMDEVRRLKGQVVFLFAGPRNEMQSFVGLSPSFRSHTPFYFNFDDFSDGEIHRILIDEIHSRFKGKMRVEGGINGVFMRILARRIGRGRGSDSFANARDVQNAVSQVLLRQAERFRHYTRLPSLADDMFLTRTDLIGPPPTSTLENSTAWKNLQDMTGLASVKESICSLITRLQTNYDRELAEKPPLQTSLNKVFLGNPGTGKTTVAKYYGEILTELGLLSNGEVIVKSCNDFIAEHTGQSENLTKAILNSARGKVLIIDEAYGLKRGHSYMECVVDTIVAEVQSTSTEDRAVLLLGYPDEMEEMFRDVNPGLARRFPMSSAFVFEDFSEEELRTILDKKLQALGLVASDQAKQVAMEVLGRARNRPHFGNAGEIDILLDRAKAAQQTRLDASKGDSAPLITELKEADFDVDYNRRDRAESNVQDAFANLVGAEALVAQFQAYQRIARNSKEMGLDPREQIPFNFIFRGPPGTGKTTTAQKLGRFFFDMGFLATTEVEICSASELIAEYSGQTGPKTQRVFQKALGKVLFIDEAYRLGGYSDEVSGHRHCKEAIDEIVNLVTHPRYKNRLVVVLAGYDRDINRLLASNPGLGSRFSEVIEFTNLSPNDCQDLLVRLLQDKKLGVGSLQLSCVAAKVQAYFEILSDLPNWGNARDVENLAKSLFGRIISAPVLSPGLDVAADCVYDEMRKMIAERRKRAEDALDFTGNQIGRDSNMHEQSFFSYLSSFLHLPFSFLRQAYDRNL